VAVRYIHFPKTSEVPGLEALPQGDRSSSGTMPVGDPRRRLHFASRARQRLHFRRSQ